MVAAIFGCSGGARDADAPPAGWSCEPRVFEAGDPRVNIRYEVSADLPDAVWDELRVVVDGRDQVPVVAPPAWQPRDDDGVPSHLATLDYERAIERTGEPSPILELRGLTSGELLATFGGLTGFSCPTNDPAEMAGTVRQIVLQLAILIDNEAGPVRLVLNEGGGCCAFDDSSLDTGWTN